MKKLSYIFIILMLMLTLFACAEPFGEDVLHNAGNSSSATVNNGEETLQESENLSQAEEQQTELLQEKTESEPTSEEPEAPSESVIIDAETGTGVLDSEYSGIIHYPQDFAPMAFDTIEELGAVLTEGKAALEHEQNCDTYDIFGIEKVQSYYVPLLEYEDYEFRKVTLGNDQTVRFYYAKEEYSDIPVFWLTSGVIDITIFKANRAEEDRIAHWESKKGLTRDADGYLYASDRHNSNMYFYLDNDTFVRITADREYDYNALRAMCNFQKVYVNSDHVTE